MVRPGVGQDGQPGRVQRAGGHLVLVVDALGDAGDGAYAWLARPPEEAPDPEDEEADSSAR